MKTLAEKATSSQSQAMFAPARGVALAYFATVTRRGNEFFRLSEALLSPQATYSLHDVEETFGVPFDALRDELVEQRAPDGTYDISMLIEVNVQGHWNHWDERAEIVSFEVKHTHITRTSSERETALVIGSVADQASGEELTCQL